MFRLQAFILDLTPLLLIVEADSESRVLNVSSFYENVDTQVDMISHCQFIYLFILSLLFNDSVPCIIQS